MSSKICALPSACCGYYADAEKRDLDNTRQSEILKQGFPKFQKPGHEEDDYQTIKTYVNARLYNIKQMFSFLNETVEEFRMHNGCLKRYRKLGSQIDVANEIEKYNSKVSSVVRFDTLSKDMKTLCSEIDYFCRTILEKLNQDLKTLAKVKEDPKLAAKTRKRRKLFDIFQKDMADLKILTEAVAERVYAKLNNLNTEGNTVGWSLKYYSGGAIGTINRGLLSAQTYPLAPIILNPQQPKNEELDDRQSSSEDEQDSTLAGGAEKSTGASANSPDSQGDIFKTPENSVILPSNENPLNTSSKETLKTANGSSSKNLLKEMPTPAEAAKAKAEESKHKVGSKKSQKSN
jgi:hypothetical protein